MRLLRGLTLQRRLRSRRQPVVEDEKTLQLEEEVERLKRFAHTQRLKGDYIAAQRAERELKLLGATAPPPRPPVGERGRPGALYKHRDVVELTSKKQPGEESN